MFFRPDDCKLQTSSEETSCGGEDGSGGGGLKESDPSQERRRCSRVRFMKQGINIVMVSVAAIVISTNVDRMAIILVAQVFNGCLLPIFSICLLLCVNDRELMKGAAQKWWANVFLFFCVLFTLFLASNVIVLKAFSGWLTEAAHRQLVSLGIATGGMFAVCLLTSLGKDMLASCKSPSTAPPTSSSCHLSDLTDINPAAS